jgi:hypothetical protein
VESGNNDLAEDGPYLQGKVMLVAAAIAVVGVFVVIGSQSKKTRWPQSAVEPAPVMILPPGPSIQDPGVEDQISRTKDASWYRKRNFQFYHRTAF